MIYPKIVKKDGSQFGVLLHNFKTKNNQFTILQTEKSGHQSLDEKGTPLPFLKFNGMKKIEEDWEIFKEDED